MRMAWNAPAAGFVATKALIMLLFTLATWNILSPGAFTQHQ